MALLLVCVLVVKTRLKAQAVCRKISTKYLLHPSYESGLGNTVNLLIGLLDYPPFLENIKRSKRRVK